MKKGFTLVEVAIVLAIIGLLTGGILAGQSLIRASELRSVTTEFMRWNTAVHSFRDQYFGLPGDITDATRYWGRFANVATCVTNVAAAVAAPGTCDGNGNGTLQRPAGASMSGERLQTWRQLALAGLIEGTYSGYTGSGGDEDIDAGENSPVARISQATWHLSTMVSGDENAYFYDVPYGLSLLFGKGRTNTRPAGPILAPGEAWGIDTKLDDGMAGAGNIIAVRWNNECSVNVTGALTNVNTDVRYRLEDSTLQCALMFRNLM